MLPLPQTVKTTWNKLASFDLRWQQRQLFALDKLSSYPGLSFVHHILPFPFQLCKRRFPIEIAFAMTISTAPQQKLRRGATYSLSPVFPPWPALCDIFQILFIWQRRCFNYRGASTARVDNDRFMTSNTVYREVLERFEYENKSLLIKYFVFIYVRIIRTVTTSTGVLISP